MGGELPAEKRVGRIEGFKADIASEARSDRVQKRGLGIGDLMMKGRCDARRGLVTQRTTKSAKRERERKRQRKRREIGRIKKNKCIAHGQTFCESSS